MNVLVKVLGEARAVGAEEVVEPSADTLQELVLDVGCASDGCRAADGVALTRDIDLEVDGRTGWVVAESAQEHSCCGKVLGLAKSAQGSLFEMEDDASGGTDRDSGRHRRQLGDGELEVLIEVIGSDGAVDANPDPDKGISGRKMIGFGEEHDPAALAGRARRANAFDKAAQLRDRTGKTDDDRIESRGLDELQCVVVPGLVVELDVAVTNSL